MVRLVSSGFLAPPILFITLGLFGALLALVWRGAGIALALGSSLCLFALATPALSSFLLRHVESGLAPPGDLHQAQAIIVLGGEVRSGDGGDIPDRLGPRSLERVVLAADAHRRLRLPVAVSGGRAGGLRASEGALMKAALEIGFAVPVTWIENTSRTTWENAVHTARLLQPDGLATVVIVTHAWHMPRALWAFQRAGFQALAWPAPRTALRLQRIEDLLPSIAGLTDSFHALHEMLGRIYYRLRY
jgi:uncharacterized SAM-binding protein YcdF (DUF218 family)